jgi:hypothetical protein
VRSSIRVAKETSTPCPQPLRMRDKRFPKTPKPRVRLKKTGFHMSDGPMESCDRMKTSLGTHDHGRDELGGGFSTTAACGLAPSAQRQGCPEQTPWQRRPRSILPSGDTWETN